MSKTAILIPARYASTRFPGKPLVELDGVPMIKRVYDACIASKLPTYVLTDDRRIADLMYLDNVPFWIDEQDEYANGTERCAGAVKYCPELEQYDQFINVQGDMPDVTLELIDKCQTLLNYYSVSTVYATMPKEMQDDPNTVKCVHASEYALWFGRGITGYGSWHLGVYGYKRNALEMYNTLPVPDEERIEQLEQLRWLKNSWQIGINPVYYKGVEINAPEDVDQWHINNKRFQ
jgi:3-deoxy-manno-octulosonate cytidylyltransferase (CMP-KDO synthetase)